MLLPVACPPPPPPPLLVHAHEKAAALLSAPTPLCTVNEATLWDLAREH